MTFRYFSGFTSSFLRMRRIRIYNETIEILCPTGGFMVTTLTMLGGSLVLMLIALWWVFHP